MEVINVLMICLLSIYFVQVTIAQDEDELLPPLINKDLQPLIYFMLDEPVVLDCKAEGTEPINYEWEKIEFDDAGVRTVVMKYSEDPGPNGALDGSVLTIDPAQAADAGYYQCTATNDHGVSLSNNIILQRALIRKPKPRDVGQFVAEEGKHFMIPCTPIKSVPTATHTWAVKEDTDNLRTSARIAYDDDGNLHFAHVIPDDEMNGKAYICHHRNAELDIKIGGNSAMLTVTPVDDAPDFGPELVYSTKQDPDAGDNTYTLITGQAARIQCIFSGKPAPIVRWEFYDTNGDRKPIPKILTYGDNGRTNLVHNSKNVLQEKDVTPPAEGTLKCTGSNSMGRVSHEIPLVIQYAPRMIVAPSALEVQAGERAILVCAADGYPTPDVKWVVNGEDVDAGDPGPRRSVSDGVIDWKPYSADNSKQIMLSVDQACNADDCEGGRDIFSIQCNASNIHGSILGSGFVAVFGEAAVAPPIDDDPNACKEPEELEAIEKCRDTFNANASSNLCRAYCHYNICITQLELTCKPQSIGKLGFCNNYCIRDEPLPPIIGDQLQRSLYFKLDEEAQLDCKAEGSEPITYEWEKIEFDDAGVRTVVRKYSEDPGPNGALDGSVLTIDPASTNDAGYYQCTASNEHGSTLSNNILLKRGVLRKPKKGDIEEIVAEEGKHFMIPCKEVRSVPKQSYTWMLKQAGGTATDHLLTSSRIAFDDNGNLHFAHVLPEDAQDGKIYMCIHRNPALDISIGGNRVKLNVNPVDDAPDFAPELIHSTKQDPDSDDHSYNMIVGKHARIQCVFSGKPTPKVTWEFVNTDGEVHPVPHVFKYGDKGNTSLLHTSTMKLKMKAMTPPAEGVLKCTGTNSLGSESAEFPIKISYPPRMIVSPSALTVAKGETAILVCGADGYPTPDVKWVVNGEDIDVANPGARRSVSDGIIDWKPYKEENSKQIILTITDACLGDSCDGGSDIFTVQCNASNIHGSTMASGYIVTFDPETVVAGGDDEDDEDEDEEACAEPEDVDSAEKCRDAFVANATDDLCLAYCHYNICITQLELTCKPQSIGKLGFCNNYCIREKLFAAPGSAEDDEEVKHAGLSKKTITVICVIIIVLIVLLILVLYKLYKKRKAKRQYKNGSNIYKPTTECAISVVRVRFQENL